MERFLLDLEYLPIGKFKIINKISNELAPEEKLNFIKGLIYLGFSTVRQEDITFASGSIGKKKTSGENKFRVHIVNPALETFLSKHPNKKTQRTFIYALLFSGINNFLKFQETLHAKKANILEIEKIEKLLFMSGMSNFFDNIINIEVSNIVIQSEQSTHSNVKPTKEHTQETSTETGIDTELVQSTYQDKDISNLRDEYPVESTPKRKWANKFSNVDAG